MQGKDVKNEKRAYTRPSIVGFRVKNPPRQFGNPIPFFNTAITHTQHLWMNYKVRDIHLFELETTTAFRIRISDQQYLTGWTKVLKDIFAEASRIMGEDVVLELSDEMSEKVKQMFRGMERDPRRKDLIFTFQPQGLQGILYESQEATSRCTSTPSDLSSCLPGLIVPTDISGNGSLRMVIPFVSMNPMTQTDPTSSMIQSNQSRAENRNSMFHPVNQANRQNPLNCVNFSNSVKATGHMNPTNPMNQMNHKDQMNSMLRTNATNQANPTSQAISGNLTDEVTGIQPARIIHPSQDIMSEITGYTSQLPQIRPTTTAFANCRSKEMRSMDTERTQYDEDGSHLPPAKRRIIAEFGINNIICSSGTTSKLSLERRRSKSPSLGQTTTLDENSLESRLSKSPSLGQTTTIDEKKSTQFPEKGAHWVTGRANNSGGQASPGPTSISSIHSARTDLVSKSSINPKSKVEPKSSSDAFQANDGCVHILKKFLSSTESRPCNTPSRYRAINESDDHSSYQVHRKSHENRLPKIACVLTHMIPPVLHQKVHRNHPCMESFTSSHKDVISKLFTLIHCSGSKWDGIYLLLPWTNMIFTRYCLDTTKPLHPSLNLIEAHRRVLKMEGACTKLVKFLSNTIWNAQKHLRRMAPKHLADAYAVLISESDSLSEPSELPSTGSSVSSASNHPTNDPTSKSYESSNDNPSSESSAAIPVTTTREDNVKIAMCIEKIAPHVVTSISPFSEQCKWLKHNRRSSMTPYSPFLTELDWGMPLLGLFHSLMPSMKMLDNEVEAQTVLLTVMAFLDERSDIFVKSIEPLLLYGARLTQYTAELQSLCQNFIELSKISGVKAVSFPDVGRFHGLDKDGMVIGFDGRSIPLGLHAVISGRENWLLPFPTNCNAIIPDKNVSEICHAHAKKEMMLVTKMLEDLDLFQQDESSPGTKTHPPILSFMADGHAKIVDILSRDSHELNTTSCLPPSASMPEACFNPDAIFVPKK